MKNKPTTVTLKLLELHPVFQAKVLKIRKVFNIEDGDLLKEGMVLTVSMRRKWMLKLQYQDSDYRSSKQVRLREAKAKKGLQEGKINDLKY